MRGDRRRRRRRTTGTGAAVREGSGAASGARVRAAPRLRVRGSEAPGAAGWSSGPRLPRGAPRRLSGRIRFLSVVGGVGSAYAGEEVRFGRG